MQSVLLLVGAVFAYGVYSYVSQLRHNIAEAKRSGFNYVVCPCSPLWLPWKVSEGLWVRLARLLPKSWVEKWLEVMVSDMSYRTGFDLFERYGEAFLVVSPRGLILHVANAELIRHVVTHKDQFPKWTSGYGLLRQFGENVLTCEGQTWRLHRRVTSPSFNERHSALVFRETIVQTQGMLRGWVGGEGGGGGGGSGVLRSLEHDTMRLALNIIGYVGFGLRLLWPGQTLPADADPTLLKYASLEAPERHGMCFVDTMASVLANLPLLLVLPKALLKLLPFERTREAAASHDEYVRYMDELMEERIDEARQGNGPGEGMDLMGQLARTTLLEGRSKLPVLGRDEIIGNAFIMFVAGHETTANTLHFSLVELATSPATQRRLQRDLDELVGDSEPGSWDYERLVNGLLGSMVGATMYETLRLLPPAAELPKEVLQEQRVSMDGRQHVVPRGTTVSMAGASVHRSPRYWPHGESRIRAGGGSDLGDFRPERWLRASSSSSSSAAAADGPDDTAGAAEAEQQQYGGYTGPDTNAQLFRPERGAYIPFSDGARSCLGRRIAQVEIAAALAVLFREHSLELAVDDWAGEGEVEAMGREARRAVYRLAQERSRRTIAGATSVLTLRLHGGAHVPVRLVRRGEERFVDWMDEGC